MMDVRNAEEMAQLLSEHPDYRVLRRFVPQPAEYLRDVESPPPAEQLKGAVYVDCETTGLDPRTCKIIELALVPFLYSADGKIWDVHRGLSYLNDPGEPLSPEIRELTGLTDEMLAGQRINMDEVCEAISQANLVVAHHADYDRKVLERPLPQLRDKYWACSYREVEWKKHYNCRASKLGILLEDALGLFGEGHRALEDCHSGVALLANAMHEGRSALAQLLESARQPTFRVWAVDSNFNKKDLLKERGFRWDPEGTGRKVWFKDCKPEEAPDDEMFARDICGARPEVIRYTGKDRYSCRV